jgi:hypothetical protein
MKEKDKQEVADIVMQSMIKAGVMKEQKVKIQKKPEPVQENSGSESGVKNSVSKLFGKKKPPSESTLLFNEFMRSQCKHGCYLCDSCEERIRNLIKNGIEKGK